MASTSQFVWHLICICITSFRFAYAGPLLGDSELQIEESINGEDISVFEELTQPIIAFEKNDKFLENPEEVVVISTNETLQKPSVDEVIEAAYFMIKINEESAKKSQNISLYSWAYSTNITDHNRNALLEVKKEHGDYAKDRWNRVQVWKDKWPHFIDERLKRQFKLYSVLGTAALPKDKYDEMTSILTEMQETYSTGKICDFRNASKCDLSLEPDIEEILKSSRDYDELVHVWKAWRDAVGKPSKKLYSRFVQLSNEAAELNGFASTAEMWTDDYESKTFEADVSRLYEQLRPLYLQLHAYTRRKLREVYGESKISKNGPIPAHVTGNMWAQTWGNLYDILVPFPNKTSFDVTAEMIKQGYTPKIMFEKADDFFASLGLERVPLSFWERSMIERPADREVVCHASAWDFSDAQDVRIKQCTNVDMEDFFTVHHELGHVQYFMLYKDLAHIFRDGANPGFHEAVGDVMSLSVSTPKHLHKVGLLEAFESNNETELNFLLKTALDTIAFLPFGYMIDKFRWEIMRGDITPENYTRAWWDHRYKLQGISPPVSRSSEDFDPAAKYHVSSNVRYIRYFVSKILQFQFHKALCQLAGEYDPNDELKPLHRCDIYQSKEAGNALREMLSLGSSVHWSTPLKILTGSEIMNASALREYFSPLEKWLTANNEEHGEFIGWEGGYPNISEPAIEENSPFLVRFQEIPLYEMNEESAENVMSAINLVTSLANNNYSRVQWNYQTNITEANKQELIKVKNAYGEFLKSRWTNIQLWKTKWPNFSNESLKRQFKAYSVLGTAALPKEKYERLNVITTEMKEIYSTGTICDYKNSSKCDLSLDPDIKNILKSSQDYDELAYIWKAWRDAVGKPAREFYTEFVQLSNEAATLNDFASTAEMWTHDYESETFEADIAKLYDQLRPLYQQLHAYTRRKLREVYGESKVSKRGPIPAHITGNMWAQTWDVIYDRLVPFPNRTSFDVTDKMIKQGFTPRIMFEKADDFFASLGLERVRPSFWNNSLIEKPEDRKVVCHANAWDFYDGEDFRIKQCTKVDMGYFFTVHHELGHVQYAMQYRHLPVVFRTGANPGFHEAVGDVLSLSVSTPKHLQKVGLLEAFEADNETDINFLMKTALDSVAFLPFGYLIDKYRWDIFRGHITPENYTKAWWELRKEFQGIEAPFPRSELDFDPAAKAHVSSNTRYIRYFVASILKFQFHKAVCLLANEYDPNDPTKPLHQCDIYQSKEAGKALSDMLKLGSSEHWSKPLKILTGSEVMDASALREYFRPLEQWLKANNEEHGEFIGWEVENQVIA